MTPQEAKALSLEVWEYLAEHPEIVNKVRLPRRLFEKIKSCRLWCPLCNLYFKGNGCSEECILFCCVGTDGLFTKWYKAVDNEDRQLAAQKIVDAIKAWEV